MAHKRTGDTLERLEYIRYEIRRGLWIKHKLHGHLCRVLKKHGKGWAILDTKNGDVHDTAEHTLWRYYQPMTNE